MQVKGDDHVVEDVDALDIATQLEYLGEFHDKRNKNGQKTKKFVPVVCLDQKDLFLGIEVDLQDKIIQDELLSKLPGGTALYRDDVRVGIDQIPDVVDVALSKNLTLVNEDDLASSQRIQSV